MLSTLKIASGAIVRPANVTAYASGQAIGNASPVSCIIDFGNVASARGNGVVITGARMFKTSVTDTNANFRLWLFQGSPASPPAADQAAYSTDYPNRALRRGFIDFATGIAGTNCWEVEGVPSRAPGIVFVPAGDRHIYGIAVVMAAYVPISGEGFTWYLEGKVDPTY